MYQVPPSVARTDPGTAPGRINYRPRPFASAPERAVLKLHPAGARPVRGVIANRHTYPIGEAQLSGILGNIDSNGSTYLTALRIAG
jgi:hypothetical protein